MSEPLASDAARELYEALDPAFTVGDEDRDWTTLRFCEVLVSGNIDAIHEFVTEHEGRPGWQIIADPDLAPAALLPWLSQLDGATLRPDMDEAARRAAIIDPEAFGRGTLEALEAVAERRLTGTKTVIITERYTGKAWRLLIETLDEETPDPDLTEAEIMAEQKPIGIVLFFNRRPVWTWKEMREEPAFATWKDVRDEEPTWFDVRTHEP